MATDIPLRCRECGQEFLFTVGEQEFFANRGLNHQPTRCSSCRAARKRILGMATVSGGHSGNDRPLYSSQCSRCGGEARVPFLPRSDRPVYCSSCYQQIKVGSS